MPRWKGFPLICLLLAGASASAQTTAPSGPALLGAAGDLSRLEVTGISPALSASLRSALAADILVQQADTPSTPTEDFLRIVGPASLEAFRNAGYKAVQLKAQCAGDLITLAVTLGPQFTAAPLRMDVPPAVNVPALAAALTHSALSSEEIVGSADNTLSVSLNTALSTDRPGSPLWEVGKPAHFHTQALPDFRSTVQLAMREQGFTDYQGNITYELDEPTHTAALHITLSDVGPKLRLAQFHVKGNRINSLEAVRSFLQLHDGQPLDLPTLHALFQQLYRSGRFYRHTLTVKPIAIGQADLIIDLQEVPGVPPLDQPLSAVEQALLRFHDWTDTLASRPDSFLSVLRSADGNTHGKLLFNLHDGLAFQVNVPQLPGDYSVLICQQGIGMRASAQSHFFAPAATRPFTLFLQLVMADELNIRAIVRTAGTGEPPVVVQTALIPSTFVAFAHRPSVTSTLNQKVLTLAADETTVTINADTGRLREINRENLLPSLSMHASLETAGLDQEVGHFRDAPDPNLFTPNALAASLSRFVAHAAIESPLCHVSPAQRRTAAMVADKLLNDAIFSPWEAFFAAAVTDHSPELHVPVTEEETAILRTTPNLLWRGILPQQLYTYGSWPWALLRVVTVPPAAADAELRRLYHNPHVGPLACIAIARTIASSDPAISQAFAALGRERLNADALKADLLPLLSADALAPRSARALLTTYRALAPAEVHDLAVTLPPAAAAVLTELYAALQLSKDQPIETALPAAVDALYPLLQPVLDDQLHRLMPAKTQPPAPVITPP